MESILRQKLKGKGQKLRIFAFLCVTLASFAVQIFPQNLDYFAQQIKNGSTEEKREALFQLRNLETAEASRIAVPALQDKNEMVRVTAAYSVVFLPSDEAAQVLLPNLKDKSPYVRRETAYALGKTKSPMAIQSLSGILQQDKDLAVKAASVVAMGEIGDIAALNFLVQILKKQPKAEEDFLRRSAARAIGQIAQVQQLKINYVVTPESILPEKYDILANQKYSNLAEKFPPFRQSLPILISVLQNSKEADDVRREVAFALGTIGDESVIPNLQNNLSAKDYYLVEICKEALRKISSVKEQ